MEIMYEIYRIYPTAKSACLIAVFLHPVLIISSCTMSRRFPRLALLIAFVNVFASVGYFKSINLNYRNRKRKAIIELFCFDILKYLPGQACFEQLFDSVLLPVHSLPPLDAALFMYLDLVCVPPPHNLLQLVQSL